MIGSLGRAAMDVTLRRGVAGVWLRGGLPPGPLVWAANHHSWWDPFVAAALLRRAGHPMALLMDQANLDRYRFARHIGAFGTANLRVGRDRLNAGSSLVIFPEGRLRVPGPPGPMAEGAAWYSRVTGRPLVAAATRVLLRAGQWPHVYVALRRVDPAGTRAEVTGALRTTLAVLLAEIDTAARTDPEAPLPGFRLAVAGRRSWNERIDLLREFRWHPR